MLHGCLPLFPDASGQVDGAVPLGLVALQGKGMEGDMTERRLGRGEANMYYSLSTPVTLFKRNRPLIDIER